MKYQDIMKAVSSLGKLKSSTGDVFSAESAAKALIKISILKGELEKAEKAIRENLPKEMLPYRDELGEIVLVKQNEYCVDAETIFKEKLIPLKDFWSAVKLQKSCFDKKTAEGKKALAVIALHETVTGEKEIIKVLKAEKIQDLDFDIA